MDNYITKSFLSIAAVLLLTIGTTVPAQQPATPPSKLIEFHMAILKKGPKWAPNFENARAVLQQHIEYAQSLLKSGKVVIAGPINDQSDLAGIYIFRAKSAEEAREWVMADPAVVNGELVPELHPWWSEDVMKKIEAPQKMITAYLAFLVKGEKWTAESTPETEEIQKGHMANIHRLADMKKLVVAGPFGDNGTLRGIFVFRVDSLEEARALTLTDPAVKAGRLALDLHPWSVPDGILP
jgi:uncharacterized protein YciI